MPDEAFVYPYYSLLEVDLNVRDVCVKNEIVGKNACEEVKGTSMELNLGQNVLLFFGVGSFTVLCSVPFKAADAM